jgi:hypothetical protein
MERRLEKAIREFISHKDWYTESRQAIESQYGSDSRLVIELIAATSPRNSVKSNLVFALRAYNHIKVGYDISLNKYGIGTPAIIPNLKRIVSGVDGLSGRKVENFRRALLGDLSAVVVDVWMLRVFNIDKKAPCKSDYDYIEATVKKLAKKVGIEPAEAQACLWAYAKRLSRGTANNYAQFMQLALDI